MTENLPDEIQYGFVYGKTLLAIGDTTEDVDRFPDGVAAKGVVRFTPKVTILRTETDPATIIKQRIECRIHQGKDDPDDPDPAKVGLLVDTAGHVGTVSLIIGQYDVSYHLEGGASVPSFTIEVTAAHTPDTPLDLALAAPIQPSPTVKFVVNEQVYLDTLAARDEAVAAAEGAGGVPGGLAGQVLAKASDDDFDTEWVDPPSGGAVDSVNGQTGAVTLSAGDVDAAPTVHGHTISDVSGLQGALDGKQPTGDYLTESDLPDLSGFVETTDPRMSDARDPNPHNHTIEDVTGLQDALDGKQPTGDYLTEGDLPAPPDLSPYAKTADLASVATSGSYDDLGDKPDIPSTPGDVGARPAGDVPWGEVSGKPSTFPPESHTHEVGDIVASGTADGTTFLRGDGTWATPPTGGEEHWSETLQPHSDIANSVDEEASFIEIARRGSLVQLTIALAFDPPGDYRSFGPGTGKDLVEIPSGFKPTTSIMFPVGYTFDNATYDIEAALFAIFGDTVILLTGPSEQAEVGLTAQWFTNDPPPE